MARRVVSKRSPLRDCWLIPELAVSQRHPSQPFATTACKKCIISAGGTSKIFLQLGVICWFPLRLSESAPTLSLHHQPLPNWVKEVNVSSFWHKMAVQRVPSPLPLLWALLNLSGLPAIFWCRLMILEANLRPRPPQSFFNFLFFFTIYCFVYIKKRTVSCSLFYYFSFFLKKRFGFRKQTEPKLQMRNLSQLSSADKS